MKFNLMLLAVAALVVAPFVVSAAPSSRGRASKAKVVEDDTPDFSKPDPKSTAKQADKAKNEKPGEKAKPAKPDEKAKKAAGKPADKPAVVFDPEPEKPEEAAVAKARKAKKPAYTKFVEAREMAWKCQQPMIVALMMQGDMRSVALEKLLKERPFLKDFVPANCVLLVWRLKPGKIEMNDGLQERRRNGLPLRPTTIDARPLKSAEKTFLSAFAVPSDVKASAARQNKPEPKYTEMRYYPQIICVNPWGSKLLFRAPHFESEKGKAGVGSWLSQVVDMFRGAQYEPTLTPSLQKIVDNPTEPKKWK